MTAACPACGESFVITKSCRRYCSQECRSGARSRFVACQTCGAQFKKYDSDPQRFCTRSCWAAHTRATTERDSFTCQECGESFTRSKDSARGVVKYCGMACLGKANGRRRKGQTTRIESACQVCAKRIEVIPALVGRKKYCSHRCNAIGVHMSGSNRPRTSKIADASIAAWSGQGAGSLAWKAEHRVSRWTIDLAFPDLMLAVELDGVYWHSRPKQIEKDRIRDAALRERGWTVLRIPMEEGATAPKIAKRIGTAVQQHISRKALVA